MGDYMVLTNTYPWPGAFKLSIEIVRDTEKNTAKVIIHAPLHMNKRKEPTFCWSCDFTDREILRDHNLVSKMIQWYGE